MDLSRRTSPLYFWECLWPLLSVGGTTVVVVVVMTYLSRLPRITFRSYLIGIALGYALVSALGVTTSHVSAVFGSPTERATVLLGEARGQRSDEFLRGTPRTIASLRGIDATSYTPLDITGSEMYEDAQNSLLGRFVKWSRPPHEVVLSAVASVLPLSIGFALLWWMSAVLLMVTVPIWFRLLGLSPRLGVLCAIAVWGTSISAWFSYLPVFLLANALLAVILTIYGLRRVTSRPVTPANVAIAVAFAYYAGRAAFIVIQYPPWGVPILLVVGVVSSRVLLKEGLSIRHLPPIIGLIAAAGTAAGLVYLHNRTTYSVVLDTVYPGQRRSAGGDSDSAFWSGALTWFMQGRFARVSGHTSPELAWGPTFLILPSLALCGSWARVDGLKQRITPALLSVVTTLVVLLWATVQWPGWLRFANPLVLVPSTRAAQIAGVLAVLCAYLVLATQPNREQRSSRAFGAAVSLCVLVVIAPKTEWMRLNFYAGKSEEAVWISLGLAAFISYVVCVYRRRLIAGTLLAAYLVGGTILVNPLTVGVHPFDSSEAVNTIQELARQDSTKRWATTGFYEDALMISTGVPQLSGQQPLGPNKDVWRTLDPSGQFEENWNRGQSYINFQWDSRDLLQVWNPSPDVIQVVANPCRPELTQLRLGWVVAINPITFDCLGAPTRTVWMGNPLYIYPLLTKE
jgi:hypothetical protein